MLKICSLFYNYTLKFPGLSVRSISLATVFRGNAVALARGGVLRCDYDYERSGTNDDADGC
jgi:hypothetical protein